MVKSVLNQLPVADPLADQVFQALGDPNRRIIVERLSLGPASVSELAEPLPMSLPGVLQHVQALEASGLVRSEKVGRVRTCHIQTGALSVAEQWIADRLSFVPFIGGGIVTIPNIFIAGLILAIMILPIVSAISREVMATVPPDHKEAALGLGATRWEMIRIAVLPYCRSGILGGAMLGLGRAIGETIAITILIGDSTSLGHHIFNQGYSLAAVIANEFGEAEGTHRAALFAAGLVLFVLTLVVNIIARVIVNRSAKKTYRGPTADTRGEGGGVLLVDVAAGV